MWSDAAAFHTSNAVEAYEGDDQVFTRTRELSIPRDQCRARRVPPRRGGHVGTSVFRRSIRTCLPRLERMSIVTAERPRDFVRVEGPQAADYLNRMVSNDVLALGQGDACDALLLTAKARVIAVLRVLRRGPEDFLLLTEPGLGDVVSERAPADAVRSTRVRSRARSTQRRSCSATARRSRPLRSRSRRPTTGYPAGRSSTSTSSSRLGPDSSSGCESRPVHRGRGQGSRRTCASRRGRPDRPRSQLLARAATRARSRSPASTTAATRTGHCACCRSSPRSCRSGTPRSFTRARPSVASRALRAPTAAWSRSDTFGSRFRRPPSSASTGPRLECVLPRARSSGDRAQPCGG